MIGKKITKSTSVKFLLEFLILLGSFLAMIFVILPREYENRIYCDVGLNNVTRVYDVMFFILPVYTLLLFLDFIIIKILLKFIPSLNRMSLGAKQIILLFSLFALLGIFYSNNYCSISPHSLTGK